MTTPRATTPARNDSAPDSAQRQPCHAAEARSFTTPITSTHSAFRSTTCGRSPRRPRVRPQQTAASHRACNRSRYKRRHIAIEPPRITASTSLGSDDATRPTCAPDGHLAPMQRHPRPHEGRHIHDEPQLDRDERHRHRTTNTGGQPICMALSQSPAQRQPSPTRQLTMCKAFMQLDGWGRSP